MRFALFLLIKFQFVTLTTLSGVAPPVVTNVTLTYKGKNVVNVVNSKFINNINENLYYTFYYTAALLLHFRLSNDLRNKNRTRLQTKI